MNQDDLVVAIFLTACSTNATVKDRMQAIIRAGRIAQVYLDCASDDVNGRLFGAAQILPAAVPVVVTR